MDYEKVKLACPAKPITHAFIYFENDIERNKFIRSANMLKKRIKRKKDQNDEIDGSRRKILQQENRIRQKLHQ